MAMSQPPHRRPSWARSELVYKAHMRSDSVHSHASVHSNSPDFGPENFSYDPDHMFRWNMPDEILKEHGEGFPEELMTYIKDWSLAGAAVCAALDRIKALRTEGLERGWPRTTAYSYLSRSAGAGTPASAGAARSPATISSPISSPMLLPVRAIPETSLPALTPPSSVISSSMSSVTGIAAPRPTTSRVVDSPPISPLDSPTPANTAAIQQAREAAAAMMKKETKQDLVDSAQKTTTANLAKLTLDLAKLNTDVDTKTDTQPNSGTSTPGSKFDQNSWEVYMNSFKAELDELKRYTVTRWTGYGKRINLLCLEYGQEEEHKAAIDAFRPWWQIMEAKMEDYASHIEVLEMPDLEEYKMVRMRFGLTV